MSLPKVRFNISKNGLGLLKSNIEKTPGLLLTGKSVASKIVAGEPYQIFSLQEAVDLGLEPANENSFAYNQIKAFYAEAKKGAELWFMLVNDNVTMTEILVLKDIQFDLQNSHYATKLINAAKGKIRILGVVTNKNYPNAILDGLEDDVQTAVINAQALCEEYSSRYNTIRCIISGSYYSGKVSELKDYTQTDYNKVAILIGNTDHSDEACIGLALGRLASIPTQRKISRVKDGPVEPLNAYFTSGHKIEDLETSWDAIDNKGYIFLRSFANRSGYYFSSDKTLTGSDDDFNSLARGLVMDEAVLIAYNVLVEELSDEILMTANGNIAPVVIKNWQNRIESNINGLMTAAGKLSGCKAFIDENQNVLVTNNIDVQLQLLPVGYADFITVNIGFTTALE